MRNRKKKKFYFFYIHATTHTTHGAASTKTRAHGRPTTGVCIYIYIEIKKKNRTRHNRLTRGGWRAGDVSVARDVATVHRTCRRSKRNCCDGAVAAGGWRADGRPAGRWCLRRACSAARVRVREPYVCGLAAAAKWHTWNGRARTHARSPAPPRVCSYSPPSPPGRVIMLLLLLSCASSYPAQAGGTSREHVPSPQCLPPGRSSLRRPRRPSPDWKSARRRRRVLPGPDRRPVWRARASRPPAAAATDGNVE